jgi:hypothetical protein
VKRTEEADTDKGFEIGGVVWIERLEVGDATFFA